jgi:hypothetical protein
MSCWRYLNVCQKAGVWDKVHTALLDRLRADEQLDLSAAVVDSSHVRAVGGGAKVPVLLRVFVCNLALAGSHG